MKRALLSLITLALAACGGGESAPVKTAKIVVTAIEKGSAELGYSWYPSLSITVQNQGDATAQAVNCYVQPKRGGVILTTVPINFAGNGPIRSGESAINSIMLLKFSSHDDYDDLGIDCHWQNVAS